jgi:hypothetical protein
MVVPTGVPVEPMEEEESKALMDIREEVVVDGQLLWDHPLPLQTI